MNFKSAILGAAFLVAAPVAASAATITVTPSLAPNAFGSPSYAAWVANAVGALHDGDASRGNAGLPSYYHAQSNVSSAEAVVTGFPSWLGHADPGAVYGAAFASELGNRMLFGLRIDGDGSQFSISQLAFSASSSDPYNALAFAFGAGSYGYSADYQGVLKGADGLLWTADDVFVTGGSSAALVDGLVGRGSGNSFAAYCPGCSVAQQQAAINDVASYPGGPFTFTGLYSLGDSKGSGTFNISGVPEPSTWAMMIAGFGLVGGFARRARQKAPAAA
ncbi:MAG TPA: PEPxxWA-CTERM sorting domain-containing protein [Phenylobacterium sp.]|nr:PEPxxWA-CTERM sorting domain-containing protein [Phenylobacterium sp.]